MNAIDLFKKYIALLDEIYTLESKTGVLDGANELVSQGANANELIIPKISMDGLGDYSRSSGYVNGNVDFTFETVKCNFDRGRMFTVDVMDNIETMGMVFGKLSSEFVRTKVIPELDAFRMAVYASLTDISTTAAADLNTGTAIISALRAATTQMNTDEVPEGNRILFIETGLKGQIDDMDTTKSKKVLEKFGKIIEMPQNRFYTAIDQLTGKTGQEAGGYKRAAAKYELSEDTAVVEGKTYYTKSDNTYSAVKSPTGDPSASSYYEMTQAPGSNINFMVIEKSAVIQFNKRVNNKIINPEQNQDADAYKYGYRQVAIADAYENKRAGIYLHKSTVTG